jgi:hypothetical protein
VGDGGKPPKKTPLIGEPIIIRGNDFAVFKMFLRYMLGSFTETAPEEFKDGPLLNEMRYSAGVNEAREKFYATGQKQGWYDFGIKGLIQAGFNPVQQFVGGFHWSIAVKGDILEYTLENKTGLHSADYHITPLSWDPKRGVMADYYQIFIFSEPKRK